MIYLRPGGLGTRTRQILRVIAQLDKLRRADLSTSAPVGQLDLESSVKLGQVVSVAPPPRSAVVATRKLGYTPADPDENVGPVLRNNPKL